MVLIQKQTFFFHAKFDTYLPMYISTHFHTSIDKLPILQPSKTSPFPTSVHRKKILQKNSAIFTFQDKVQDKKNLQKNFYRGSDRPFPVFLGYSVAQQLLRLFVVMFPV
jgi:hypothetical protein